MPTSNLNARISESTTFVNDQIPLQLQKPQFGIICGSGLGDLKYAVEAWTHCKLPYSDIPYFPRTTVPGHAGELLFGAIGETKVRVVIMVGRAHCYEGHSLAEVTFPVRVLKSLGVENLIVTNAAGALNANYGVGDFMMLMDHINLPGMAGLNPLRGFEDPGLRFIALSDAYDLDLRHRIRKAWRESLNHVTSRRLHEGTYAFVSGPNYETRAECRMLKFMGADVVGMSTVPEVLVARQLNMKTIGLSLITNKAIMDPGPRSDDPNSIVESPADLSVSLSEGKADHEEVLKATQEAASDFKELLLSFLRQSNAPQSVE